VVLAEPPPAPAFAAFGDTLVTFAWTAAGERHIQSRADELLLGRTQMVTAYRAVRDNADDPIAALKAQLPNPRIAARAATALAELSLLRVDPATGTVESINADPNAKIDLELSFTFRSYSEYREASAQWLPQLNTQTQRQ
jgi:hypothetical protein